MYTRQNATLLEISCHGSTYNMVQSYVFQTECYKWTDLYIVLVVIYFIVNNIDEI